MSSIRVVSASKIASLYMRLTDGVAARPVSSS